MLVDFLSLFLGACAYMPHGSRGNFVFCCNTSTRTSGRMYTPCIFDWKCKVDIAVISKVLGGDVLMTWYIHKMESNFRWVEGSKRKVPYVEGVEKVGALKCYSFTSTCSSTTIMSSVSKM